MSSSEEKDKKKVENKENKKDNKEEKEKESKEKNNKKEHKEEKGNKEEKEKGSKEEKEKVKEKGKDKEKEKEDKEDKEDKEQDESEEKDSKEKDSKEKDNKKEKSKNTKKTTKKEPKKVTKPKKEKKKPEPKTLHFKSWSLAMEDGGLFINGIVKEDKEEIEYHTAPISQIKDSHEVVDKEGNTIILKGKLNREESLNSGLSESFVDLFKEGFFTKNFQAIVKKEKNELLQRIRMRTIDWHDLAFVGIELKGLKDIYKEPFEFPDLERELTEGILSRQEYPLYCFMASQPLYLGGVGSSTRILQVPYIVVIDCEVPPPNKIGYHSVQLGINRVIDFKKQKSFATFQWEPYIPSRIRTDSKLPKPMIHHLKWTVRSSKMNGFNEKDQHYIEYLLPYIELPQLIEEEKKPEDSDTTQVSFKWKFGGKYYDIVFDKEIDRTATFIPEFLEDNKLKGKVEEEEIKKALQEEFKRVREKKLKDWEKKQKLVENMTEKQREALRNIKIYKFYPSHPEIRKPHEEISNPKINQYFGNADKVFVPEPPEIDEKKLKKMQEAALKKQEQEEKRRIAEEKRRSPKRRKRRSPSPSPKKKTTTNKRRKKEESSEEMSDEDSESSQEKKSSKKKKSSTPTKRKSSPRKKKQESSDESQSVEDSDSDDSSEPKKKNITKKKSSTPTKKKSSTPTKKGSTKKNK